VQLVELAPHDRAQHPLPAVRGGDGHPGDARRRDDGAGHGQLAGVDARRGHHLLAVEERERAVQLGDRGRLVGVRAARVLAEHVRHGPGEPRPLVGGDGTQLVHEIGHGRCLPAGDDGPPTRSARAGPGRTTPVPSVRGATIPAMTGQQPIGWWVKRLDELLEQVVDLALAGEGITRRHWQVMHALGSGGMEEDALRSALSPFGGPVDVTAVLAELTGRSWVTGSRGGWVELTEVGRAAHERLFGRIGRLRRQVTDGFTAEEYERTVAALRRMVANTERALAEARTDPAEES
jgi:hypothetical protein